MHELDEHAECFKADSFSNSTTVIFSLALKAGLNLIVLHSCASAGQAVIQFAQCTDDHSQYAIKFFFDRQSFLTEAALYAACRPEIPAALSKCASGELRSMLSRTASGGELHLPQAAARCLPQLEAIVDCEADAMLDPRFRPLPSCIVMERGESLHEWADRAEPDIFTCLAVCFNSFFECCMWESLHCACRLTVGFLCASAPFDSMCYTETNE